jgi:hypothetical protein
LGLGEGIGLIDWHRAEYCEMLLVSMVVVVHEPFKSMVMSRRPKLAYSLEYRIHFSTCGKLLACKLQEEVKLCLGNSIIKRICDFNICTG